MGYFVDVTKAGGDAIRAYRKIKRKIKDDKFIENLRDRQYYKKPSEVKREKNKQARITIKRNQAKSNWKDPSKVRQR
jgi:ribosomal protein S21|tara:strand:+ start:1610 stop:1840 length:231 start_codon:yes stop_codon:yes gene_type:complete